MARKRRVLYHRVQLILRHWWRWIGVAIVTLLAAIALSSHPANARLDGVDSAIVQSDLGSLTPQELNARGRVLLERGDARSALEVWQQAEQLYREQQNNIGVLGSRINQAQAWQDLGRYRQSLLLLQSLEDEYSITNLVDESLKATYWLSLGNALRAIGDLEKSQESLEKALEIVSSGELRDRVLLSLANTQAALGKQAQNQLDFLAVSEIFKDVTDIMLSRQDLAAGRTNFYHSYKNAFDNYQTTRMQASSALMKTKAEVNMFVLAIDVRQWWNEKYQIRESEPNVSQPQFFSEFSLDSLNLDSSQIERNIDTLPLAFSTLQVRRQFADSLIQSDEEINVNRIASFLNETLLQARDLNNKPLQSYTLGQLGKLYERTGEYDRARELTSEALAIAQSIQAWDIAYQWQWQLGRLHLKTNEFEKAKQAYETAVNTLDVVRSSLVAIDPDLKVPAEDEGSGRTFVDSTLAFSFRDRVEPLYREYISLLLPDNNSPLEPETVKALSVVEMLQVAELENFLGCKISDNENSENKEEVREGFLPNHIESVQNKVEATLQKIHTVDPNAAVIYPVVLDDRVELLYSLRGSEVLRKTSIVDSIEVSKYVSQLRDLLVIPDDFPEVKGNSYYLYQWFIQPIESELDLGQTLVFGLDALLQNIPMSVLYDRDDPDYNKRGQYLVEKYDIAVVPSLQLQLNLIQEEGALSTQSTVLAGGLSNPLLEGEPGIVLSPVREGFQPLPQVENEIRQIASVFPETTSLLNEAFTANALQNRVSDRDFSILHLATHGIFSSQPEQTYILAADEEIEARQLAAFLRLREQLQGSRKPIELLVLSACQTAKGDRRAALGLAGIAIQAGARTAIGSLWPVDDTSTADLMEKFYEKLAQQSEISRVKAFNDAQRSLINEPPKQGFENPFYWAPFVLVGNWL